MYIFRLPAQAQEIAWTYIGLVKFISQGKRPHAYRKIGKTITVEYSPVGGVINVRLYDTVIAAFWREPRKVWVPQVVDQHHSQATREWLSQILGRPVFSENFTYYVHLTLSGHKVPVAGYYHPERSYA